MKLLATALITPIKFYQKWISPSLAPRCKYYPSCSQYTVDAIGAYGLKGIAMAGWRLLRCNPWSHGGVDYAVPRDENFSQLSASLTTKEVHA
jgi:putative membrane protein insertion efficiency factor